MYAEGLETGFVDFGQAVTIRSRSRMNLASTITSSIATFVLIAASAAGQTAYKAPRVDGHPDLNGIWQANNTANWDLEGHAAAIGPVPSLGAEFAVPPGLSVVEGGKIPYLPEAEAKKKANFARRFRDDPEIRCYLPGIPRATYMPYPFQIVQGRTQIMFTYEFAGGVRSVNMGKAGEAPVDSWMGWSAGRWEGDALVVDVTGLNAKTWFDRAGNFHSNELHVVERYTPRSADTLMYEATMEDPKTFSKPWKISMPLYRRVEKDARLLEYKCPEFTEELIYGPLRKQPKKQIE